MSGGAGDAVATTGGRGCPRPRLTPPRGLTSTGSRVRENGPNIARTSLGQPKRRRLRNRRSRTRCEHRPNIARTCREQPSNWTVTREVVAARAPVPSGVVGVAPEADDATQAAADALAEALIKARGDAGMTQEQVAQAMGTTHAAVVRLESGRTMPSMRTLERFAQATKTRLRIRFEPEEKPVTKRALKQAAG